ncbi:MAG: hypothetical protein IH616_11595 [Gemmatimonadales bacterium]|nr:hypothetical protein [Gemmatimonadales bacterium]
MRYSSKLLDNCYAGGRSQVMSTPGVIPEGFVRRARAHVERTGQPYLEHRADDYRLTLVARRLDDGRYQLRAEDVLERAAPSWRDLFRSGAAGRISEDDFLAFYGIEPARWDDTADCAAADQLLLSGWRRSDSDAETRHPLAGMHLPRFVSELDGAPLGCTAWVYGPGPMGPQLLFASCAMALSCLQHWLDEHGAGVRLQVG